MRWCIINALTTLPDDQTGTELQQSRAVGVWRICANPRGTHKQHGQKDNGRNLPWTHGQPTGESLVPQPGNRGTSFTSEMDPIAHATGGDPPNK